VGVVRAVFSVAWFSKLCEAVKALPVAEQEEREISPCMEKSSLIPSIKILKMCAFGFHVVNFSFLDETTEPESSSRD